MVCQMLVARIGKKPRMWLDECAWTKYEYNIVMRGRYIAVAVYSLLICNSESVPQMTCFQ